MRYIALVQNMKIRRNSLLTTISLTVLYISYRIGYKHGYQEGLYKFPDTFNIHNLLVLPEIFLK